MASREGPAEGREPIGARLRAAVAVQIAAGHDPDDPASGCYVSPESAWDGVLAVDLSPFGERLAAVVERLGLDEIASDVLALCVAPELDSRIGRVFAFLLDDATCRLPTARLVASVLAGRGVDQSAVLARLAVDAPLRRRGCLKLLDEDGRLPLADQPVRVAAALTSFLLGVNLGDPEADGALSRAEVPDYPIGRDAVIKRIRAALGHPDRRPLFVAGPDAPGVLAVSLGRPLVLVDAATDEADLPARASLIGALEGRSIGYDVDRLAQGESWRLRALVRAADEPVLMCAERATAEVLAAVSSLGAALIDVPMPSLEERRLAWLALAAAADVDAVASKFRLSSAQIAHAAGIAKLEASARGGSAPGPAELDEGARRASAPTLGDRAARLRRHAGWEDLVVPERQLAQLRAVSASVRHRDKVLAEWGFERTTVARPGLTVLFSGEPGTGKTMAAGVLAGELGMELFTIDLSAVVSKYVGETERNLERIFTAAAGSNAILLFDEADALFGRRSEVSDARDRYANIEVAYLLQRMEAHQGAAILATNLKQNLDDAFLRRLDFVIDFPFPGPSDRRRLWRRIIPPEAPIAGDVDTDFLAEQFKLSGGSIRNCAIAAALEAAAADKPIAMSHLVRAVAGEYGKLGRLAIEADFGPYQAMLSDPDAAPEPAHESPPAARPAPVEPVAPERVVVRARIDEL